MSEKNLDDYGRFRSKTVGFRVSPEEWEHLNKLVALSGLSKQDYMSNLICKRDLVVMGNPRVAKALKDELANVLTELRSISSSSEIGKELLETIQTIATIIDGLHNNEPIKKH